MLKFTIFATYFDFDCLMTYKRILIFKTGAIGDFIASTIAIRAIREHYPEAWITLVANKPNDQTVPAGSIVDEFIEYESTIKEDGYWKFFRKLRKGKYDLAVNLKWNNEFFSILSFLVARDSAGTGGSFVRSLFTYKPDLNVINAPTRHEYLLNLDIAECLGFKVPTMDAYVFYGEDEAQYIDQFFKTNQINTERSLLMAPGASTYLKAWKKDRFIEIGKRFVKDAGGSVIVSWAPEDKELAEEVAASIGDGAVLSPPTTLRQIFALVAGVKFLLCNNSGILHMGYATKTPTVCLNASVGWHPFGPISRSVIDIEELESRYDKKFRKQTNYDLEKELSSITVDQAWSKIEDLWNEVYGEKLTA